MPRAVTPRAQAEIRRFAALCAAMDSRPMVTSLVFSLDSTGAQTEVAGYRGSWEIGGYYRERVPVASIVSFGDVELAVEDSIFGRFLRESTVDFIDGQWRVEHHDV